ncbi:hypothetical protein [uncultured Campylobacter sp.]|uniref:hypothetical protein n=1 Tax=uncultured Campylobacter sp. TaxID=218934 RepID=UPI0028F12A36|nr:hypothetical protein [uncultured Campylobacter sp.]
MICFLAYHDLSNIPIETMTKYSKFYCSSLHCYFIQTSVSYASRYVLNLHISRRYLLKKPKNGRSKG